MNATAQTSRLNRDIVLDRPGPAQPAGLRITRLEKHFDGNHVLRGLDLDIEPGSFVAIIGKSGCGKSTLLRILMGLEQQTSGGMQFHDGRGEAMTPSARIVFQEPRLLPWSTVIDNVAIGLNGKGEPEEIKARARQALKEVQLATGGAGARAGQPARLSGA